jgi:hypothetical protein
MSILTQYRSTQTVTVTGAATTKQATATQSVTSTITTTSTAVVSAIETITATSIVFSTVSVSTTTTSTSYGGVAFAECTASPSRRGVIEERTIWSGLPSHGQAVSMPSSETLVRSLWVRRPESQWSLPLSTKQGPPSQPRRLPP